MVRFQGASGGFYADAEGFLFPLQLRHTARVPVVDGALPLKIDKNFKGAPETEKERQWVLSVLDLVRWLGARKEWNDLVGQIRPHPPVLRKRRPFPGDAIQDRGRALRRTDHLQKQIVIRYGRTLHCVN